MALEKPNPEKAPIKIGCLIQTPKFLNNKALNNRKAIINHLKDKDFDILVCPEFTSFGFEEEFRKFSFIDDDLGALQKNVLEFSELIKKAVFVCGRGSDKRIFGIYANARAKGDDTKYQFILKHSNPESEIILLREDFETYKSLCEKYDLFTPILYHGWKIGPTICMDCNCSLFSALYGDIDILINGTGGFVNDKKWYAHSKARAIENKAYNFVTMGMRKNEDSNKYNSYYAFDDTGNELEPVERVEPVGNVKDWLFVFKTEPSKKPYLDVDRQQRRMLCNDSGITNQIVYDVRHFLGINTIVIKGDNIFNPLETIKELFAFRFAPHYKGTKPTVIQNTWVEKELSDYQEKQIVSVLISLVIASYSTVVLNVPNKMRCYRSSNRSKYIVSCEYLSKNNSFLISKDFASCSLFKGWKKQNIKFLLQSRGY